MLDAIIYWVGIVSAGAAAAWALTRETRRVVALFHRWYHRLDQITLQLAPNGGTSLVDRVATIEKLSKEGRAAELIHTQRWRIVTDRLGLAYWEATQSGYWVYVSDQLASAALNRAEDLLGLKWIAAVHQDDRERVYREWTAAVRDGGRFALSFRFTGPGGRESLIRATASPVTDPAGVIHYWIGILQQP